MDTFSVAPSIVNMYLCIYKCSAQLYKSYKQFFIAFKLEQQLIQTSKLFPQTLDKDESALIKNTNLQLKSGYYSKNVLWQRA